MKVLQTYTPSFKACWSELYSIDPSLIDFRGSFCLDFPKSVPELLAQNTFRK